MIVKFTPNGVESTFATDLDFPRGVAFDRSGNLFVAQRGLVAPPGAILKFTPDGVGTVFASEVPDPQFLAFQLLPTPTSTSIASSKANVAALGRLARPRK
jgi:hypothetical protein